MPVAGVAWAQHKGIEAVEVRVDRGPWHQATLAAVPDIDTWRQWTWQWDATPGTHLIEARATDKTGYTQTSAVADVAPNGATGYPLPVTVHGHRRLVRGRIAARRRPSARPGLPRSG